MHSLKIFNFLTNRVLNFIDIDCGPLGNCTDDITKTRNDFRGVFEAGWNKINKNLEKIDNMTAAEIAQSLKKRCPGGFSYQQNSKNTNLCQSTFLLFKLGHENTDKSLFIHRNITNGLLNTNLFKEMSLIDFENKITLRLLKEVSNFTKLEAIKINWNCTAPNCTLILASSYKFFYKISALTSRVTKLGTLLTWSNSYDQAADHLKTVYDKMSMETANVALGQLVLALAPGIFIFIYFSIVILKA